MESSHTPPATQPVAPRPRTSNDLAPLSDVEPQRWRCQAARPMQKWYDVETKAPILTPHGLMADLMAAPRAYNIFRGPHRNVLLLNPTCCFLATGRIDVDEPRVFASPSSEEQGCKTEWAGFSTARVFPSFLVTSTLYFTTGTPRNRGRKDDGLDAHCV